MMMSAIWPDDVLILAMAIDGGRHDLTTAVGDLGRYGSGLARLPGIFGIFLHGGGNFLHGRGGLLKARRLLLGALRQIGRAGRNLARSVGDFAGRRRDRTDRFLQAFGSGVEVVADLTIGLREPVIETDGEIAFRDFGEPTRQSVHDAGLLRGGLGLLGGPLVSRLGLRPRVSGALFLGQFAVGLGFLFQADFLDAAFLKDQDGVGHLADFVAAIGSRHDRLPIWIEHQPGRARPYSFAC